MKKLLGLFAAVCMFATCAFAGEHIGVRVNVGYGQRYYVPVYATPVYAPVYITPNPIYVAPAPVIVVPAPEVVYVVPPPQVIYTPVIIVPSPVYYDIRVGYYYRHHR